MRRVRKMYKAARAMYWRHVKYAAEGSEEANRPENLWKQPEKKLRGAKTSDKDVL